MKLGGRFMLGSEEIHRTHRLSVSIRDSNYHLSTSVISSLIHSSSSRRAEFPYLLNYKTTSTLIHESTKQESSEKVCLLMIKTRILYKIIMD